MHKITLLLTLLMSFQAFALIDFSGYELTEPQIELLRKMEAKGDRTEEWLHYFAGVMERSNIQRARQSQIYIPPYTPELLREIQDWARGAAFSGFAKEAGVLFDNEAYREDCPNWAVFNFNRAHGGRHMGIDLTNTTLGMSHFLQVNYRKEPSNFQKIYLEEAEKNGMLKYITVLED